MHCSPVIYNTKINEIKVHVDLLQRWLDGGNYLLQEPLRLAVK